MSSFWSSWFPDISLSSLSPSVSLQRRFISFVLKRCLGHLVKPGQLDAHQIEAQIGNGHVEIKDIELDNDAVNTILGPLPVQLQGGSLAVITAQIPWPNPFSSTIGLSISGLRLTLKTSDSVESRCEATDDLAHSVANAANEFVHEEMADQERDELRNSIVEDDEIHFVPGSIDSSGPRKGMSTADNEPEGTTLFGGLLESLLARFEFVASDMCLTLVHPDVAEYAVRITRVSFGLENVTSDMASAGIRALTVGGLTISCTCHDSIASDPPTRESHGTNLHRPMTGDDSDSEMDEETQMLMSQSLVALPPRREAASLEAPASPASSTSETSILYSSAAEYPLDSRASVSANESDTRTTPSDCDHVMVFSEPIVCEFISTGTTAGMNLRVTTGIIASALRSQHLARFIKTSQLFAKFHKSSGGGHPSGESPGEKARDLEASVRIKGLVLLILGESEDRSSEDLSIRRLFERPLTTPYIECGYIRLHIDGVDARLHGPTTRTDASLPTESTKPDPPASTAAQTSNPKSVSISDISILAFLPRNASVNMGETNLCSPILVTDENLFDSYVFQRQGASVSEVKHEHPYTEDEKQYGLPSIGVVDWTAKANQVHGASLRPWRCRQSASHVRTLSGGQGAGPVDLFGHSPPAASVRKAHLAKEDKVTPAINILVREDGGVSAIEMKAAPLHVFVDLDLVRNVSSFLDGFMLEDDKDAPTEVPSVASSTHVRRTGVSFAAEEKALGLTGVGDDYADGPVGRKEQGPQLKGSNGSVSFEIEVDIPLLRFELRVPPLRRHSELGRSGSLVLDVHDFVFSNHFRPNAHVDGSYGEQDGLEDWFRTENTDPPLLLRTGRITWPLKQDNDESRPFGPLFCFRGESRKLPTSQKAVLVKLPSVHVDLEKGLLDGLQLWADDVAQWIESLSNEETSTTNATADVSRTTSLLGSRYFVERPIPESFDETSTRPEMSKSPKGETVLKLLLSEGFVRLHLAPHQEGRESIFDICATGVDALIESKPEGKEELVVSTVVSVLSCAKGREGRHAEKFVYARPDRSAKQCALRLTFRSMPVPETIAKESRLKLFVSGLLFDLNSTPAWTDDFVDFAKPPPGVFESVVPSERTYVSVDLVSCLLRIGSPPRGSAMLTTLDAISFSTELEGDSYEKCFNLTISELSSSVADNVHEALSEQQLPPQHGSDYWAPMEVSVDGPARIKEKIRVPVKKSALVTGEGRSMGMEID